MRLLAFIACREAQLQTTGKCFPALEIWEMCEQDMTDPTSHIVETPCTVPGLEYWLWARPNSSPAPWGLMLLGGEYRGGMQNIPVLKVSKAYLQKKHEAKGILGTGGMNTGMRKSHWKHKNGRLKVSQAGEKYSNPGSRGPGAWVPYLIESRHFPHGIFTG